MESSEQHTRSISNNLKMARKDFPPRTQLKSAMSGKIQLDPVKTSSVYGWNRGVGGL